MIEIDGVRRELEAPIWESGDYISDEYYRLIDLSTSPDRTIQSNIDRIASAIRRLNRNLGTTSAILDGTSLAGYYDQVIVQLNTINSDIGGLESLQPIISDESRLMHSSGSFEWA